MIDFRLYRIAFLPALVALVVTLFSLQPVPPPLEPSGPVGAFDQARAVRTAERIAELAPSRPPGSDGDETIADLVEDRFRELDLGLISEQRFEGSFDGDEVPLRNVILTLPGESDRTIAVLAPRDSGEGAGAGSSAAATAVLLELAARLAASEHEKTVVLVSTSGSAEGAWGASEFARAHPSRDSLEAAVVVSQPGSPEPRQPFVVGTTGDGSSPSAQLVATAREAVATEAGVEPAAGSGFDDLARLAVPSGLGEQTALIEEGLTAVAISSAGEAPLTPEGELDGPVLGEFGRAALATLIALEQRIEPLEHGPDSYVRFAGNLLPGWALALLALALIVPAAIAAVDAVARTARRDHGAGRALAWAALAVAPALASILVLYGLALVGFVPRPPFPFDPGLYAIGAGELVALALVAAAGVAAWLGLRPWRMRPAGTAGARAAALGLLAAVAGFITWLANPFLALLTVPAVHAWVVHGRATGPASLPVATLSAIVAAAPPALALAHVVDVLDLGVAAPWHLSLMVADGQLGAWTIGPVAVIFAALVGVLAIAASAPRTGGRGRSRQLERFEPG